MMKQKTKCTISAIATVLLASSIAYADAEIRSYSKDVTIHYGIRVALDGEYIDLIDSNGKIVDAFIYQDTAYVPLKTLAPMLGGTTQYDATTNTVDVHDHDGYITNLYVKKVESLEETIDKYQELVSLLVQQNTYSSSTSGIDSAVQQSLDELNSLYQKYYIDYYNIGNDRLDSINNGTANNQDAWQRLYNSMGEQLNDMAQHSTDVMQAANKANSSTKDTLSISYSFPLHLYSNDGKVYLGKCVIDDRDKDSIWYAMVGGDYSSEFSKTSIWNTFGEYGSNLIGKNNSAFNDNAKTPPKIVDNDGTFVAYLTTNEKIENGWTIEKLRQFVVNNGQ